MAQTDITGFLRVWHAFESLLLVLGFGHISDKLISSGLVSFGVISFGGFASFGVIAFGGVGSCRIISVGVGSCGVISIGGQDAVGIIAVSTANAYGLITISTGYKQFIGTDQYTNGKAFGLIAVGRHARGVYALSYNEEGEGTYQFSPKRQDPEAVALFTRLFRKYKRAFASPS